MEVFGLIGGTGLSKFENKRIIFLQRHGKGIPPHMVDNKANIKFFKDKGIKKIIGVCSVGSLKEEIKPGTIIIPNDYINLKNIQTYYDLSVKHITPGLSKEIRELIIKSGPGVLDKGIYVQTIGPRFETPAEINLIKNYADIVGMTMANEATLAKELGLEYAAICMVDNYAMGISEEVVTFESLKKAQAKNLEAVERLLDAIIVNIS